MNVDLGSLCLVSTTADLELQLSSYAQLTATDSDFTMAELVAKAMDSQSTVKPWISRGSTLKLTVSLALGGNDAESRSMMQTFSRQLYHSEMWSQLCLEPTSMIISDSDTVKIQLSTSSKDIHRTKEQKRHHKLSDDSSCSIVQSYLNSPVLELSNVYLAMRVIQKQETQLRKSSQFNPRNRLETFAAGVQPLQPAGSMANDECTLDPQHLKRLDSTTEVGQCRNSHLQHELLAVLDAGILFAITTSPTRLAKGIRLDARESFKTLAEFAPSVWSPGYLEAMASRSLLLPSISRAFSRVGIGNAKSPNLEAKLAEVVRRAGCHMHRSPVAIFPDLQQVQLAQLSIGSRLWQVAQSTVLDSRAACRLKNLLPNSDSTCGGEHESTLDLENTSQAKESDARNDSDCDGALMDVDDSGDDLLLITFEGCLEMDEDMLLT